MFARKNCLQTHILYARKLFEFQTLKVSDLLEEKDLKAYHTQPAPGSDLIREIRPPRGSDLVLRIQGKGPSKPPFQEHASQFSPKTDTIEYIKPKISYTTSVFLENIKKLLSQDTIYLSTMLSEEIGTSSTGNNVLNKLIHLVSSTRVPNITTRK